MAKKYTLTIELNDFDLVRANKTLSTIGGAIENGLSRSNGFPAIWELNEIEEPINASYEHFDYIDENGKALDENFNEYRDSEGCCVYVCKEDRHHFSTIKL